MVLGGCQVLDWLIEMQTGPNGTFSPVGNRGWWPRKGAKSQFDQQPIEAMALVLAAEDALSATADERYRRAAEMAYAWFLGANDGGIEVAVPLTGGCRDGLTPNGLNDNQGAESTLAWLTALEHIRVLRAADAGAVANAPAWAEGSATGSRS